MKTQHVIFTMLLLLMACSKDDGPNQQNPIDQPDPNNQAPESFGLISVADNSTDVQPNPTFSWDTASDPDGDTVTYDFFIDTQEEPETKMAEGIETATFKVPDSLALCRARVYFWKVVAKDGKGGETISETFGFTVRTFNDAEQLTPINPFKARSNHASVVLNGIWVLGGQDNNGSSDHAWLSNDGSNWSHTNVNMNSIFNFPPRFFHAAASFNDKIWIAGGVVSNFSNDVWTSTDGATWTEVDQVQEYTARAEHTLTVFQDKLWVIGGGG